MPYSTRPRRGSAAPRYQNARHFGGQSSRGANRRGPAKTYINPLRFVKAATPSTEIETFVPLHAFDDFAIDPILKKNIAAKGFTMPSPIQDQTIPLGLAGKDVIGIANTGTGKTIAFAVPVLSRLMQDTSSKALVVAPTRELAQQIEDEFRAIAKGGGLNGALLIGGTAMGPQLQDLRHDPRIIIGTPGRIKDHLERGSLKLSNCSMVVLDEVDRMLDMGFVHDVSTILGQLATPRQSFFFSATMNHEVSRLIGTFANEPVTVSVKTGDTADNVHQDIVCYETSQDKIEQLHNILIKEDTAKTIIFDETQRSVERLSKELEARGFKVDAIHGGKTQGQRQRALDRFKRSDINVLVATDVAARGLDVKDITHVINYATPSSYEDYVHRIGRAGRAGRVGYALTFVTDRR